MPLLTILKGFNEHQHKTHKYTLDPFQIHLFETGKIREDLNLKDYEMDLEKNVNLYDIIIDNRRCKLKVINNKQF